MRLATPPIAAYKARVRTENRFRAAITAQTLPSDLLWGLARLAVFGAIFYVGVAHAQVIHPSTEPTNEALSVEGESPASARQLRVLDSQEVILGPRSIIYNRVETPALLPQPAPAEKSTAPAVEPTPTAEELAEMQRWEVLNHVTLFLSCTVYDDQLTEVRFRHGDSDITFWSTVNFHYLSQLLDLQTKDTYYFIMMGIGDSTTEEVLQQSAELQRMGRLDLLSTPPADLLDARKAQRQSTWRITSKGPVPPEAQRAIEDLHAHFDANRDALIAARAEREAAWAAHEQWIKDNPPQPKDTVIQFFPIRSSHSPTEARVLAPTEATQATRER